MSRIVMAAAHVSLEQRELRELLQALSLTEFEASFLGHDWQHWTSLPRLKLLEALKASGLSLKQRQQFANAWFKAVREGRVPSRPSSAHPASEPAHSASKLHAAST